MLAVSILPLAKQDIEEIVDWLNKKNPQAAEQFLEQLEKSFDLLAMSPFIGHLRRYENPVFKNIRMFSLKQYSSYLIFYQTSSSQLQIIRVLHGSRDITALFEK